MSKLINWKELSRRLTGSGETIRSTNVPKKYERKINKLLKYVEKWEEWIDKQD